MPHSVVTPRVTVLLPVYNGAAHLAEALQSILRQSFCDFELLVVDDGSTDGSDRIAESFRDPRLRLLRHEKNLGLVAALNAGLAAARGEYVARMDADDVSRPRRLEKQVRFLDSHPEVGVCGSWVRFFPEGKVWKLPRSSQEIRCWSFTAVGVAHPAVMLRRELFARHGLTYDARYRHIEDYELWGRALSFMEFANLPEVLLDYRVGPQQICARHRTEQLETVVSLRAQRLRELGIEPTAAQQRLHEAVVNCAPPADAGFLEDADRWLARIAAANRQSGTYPAAPFERRLLEIWFALCLSLAMHGGCSWRRCRSGKLWCGAPASFRARAFGAWVAGGRGTGLFAGRKDQ